MKSLTEVVSTVDTTPDTTNNGGFLDSIGEFVTNHKNGCIATALATVTLTGLWWLSRKKQTVEKPTVIVIIKNHDDDETQIQEKEITNGK